MATKKKTAKTKRTSGPKPVVAILMGSISDWETMKHCAATLDEFGIPYDKRVLSGHRTPKQVVDYAEKADANGIKVIVAAAGGAAHLAGMVAGNTELPVLGVPMKGWSLDGLDSLLSTVQMPAGIPVMTLAIGKAGAINAAMSAVAILALSSKRYKDKLHQFRLSQTRKVLNTRFPAE